MTEALWNQVLDDFGTNKTHEAFLTHCRDNDALADAARRYRAHKDSLNEDQQAEREAIDQRLAAIAILAMSQLDERRSQPRAETRGRKLLTLVAAVLAVASVLALANALTGAF